MGWWEKSVVPRVVDHACSNALLDPARERAASGLHGRVLEIGFGSGTSCRFLGAHVEKVLAVEPSDVGWQRSAQRRATASVPVQRIGLDGHRIELDDDSVDTVLVTFTLCTVEDPRTVLAEARRALRPGGTLHVAEHGAAPDPVTARAQHRLDGLQRRLFGGCHLTRDPASMLADAGFVTQDLDQSYLPVPRVGRPWAFVTSGVCRPPAHGGRAPGP